MLMQKIDHQNVGVRSVEPVEMQWFACRVKQRHVGGIRKITVGGEFEAYRGRGGTIRQRRIEGTGQRVFLPEHLLRKAGFSVFLPIKKELRRKSRTSPEKHLVSFPLLAGWIFVGWPVGESRWHELMALDVVAGVMSTGGHPVEIPPARIRQLMRQWGGGMLSPECHKYLKHGAEFAIGDTARVVSGPFEGQKVRVIDVKDASVRGLLNILGGETEVEISASVLDMIASAKR